MIPERESVYHPFQALSAAATRDEKTKFLFAACGSSICSLDVKTWKVMSQWSPENSELKSLILALLVSPDLKYLIASTAEEKTILTFLIRDSGELELLGARHMPKRPCALAIDCDERHILCGDKFGDVYCLPLHGTGSQVQNGTKAAARKPFKPSANEFTVHTKRNRKALRNQMETHHSLTNEKDNLDFEHQLIIGHVSMLTDIISARVELKSGSVYSCIITADRDEHIRITRARPQTHIINGYCLGHKSFVSKLCLPTPRILISGGGDEELLVWDWYYGKLLGSINVFSAIGTEKSASLQGNSTAVTGIWALRSGDDRMNAVCICERIDAVYIITAKVVGDALCPHGTKVTELSLIGKPLDVAIFSDILIISVDVSSSFEIEETLQMSSRLAIYQLVYKDDGEVLISRPNPHLQPHHDWLRPVKGNIALENDLERMYESLYSSARVRKRDENG